MKNTILLILATLPAIYELGVIAAYQNAFTFTL